MNKTFLLATAILVKASGLLGENGRAAAAIACPSDAPANVKLAAQEVRRYVYLRTGELLSIKADRGMIRFQTDSSLEAEEYRLKSDGSRLVISGGSDVAVLYGAYAFAEKLGVRFYLHGDTIPDQRVPLALPLLDEVRKPLFETRGIQPFHDFPEGPDWWNQDDYLAYLSQLAKLRMNFLGLHCYPEGGVGPESLVWIGLPEDLRADGTVRFSYPSYWHSTARSNAFNYAPMKTSEYSGGAAQLFPADDYGPEVMEGCMPLPQGVEQSNELFDRVGRQMRVVFAEARRLGVKTCVGTETPLTIPSPLRERIKQSGRNPDDPAARFALYLGMFQRIAQVYPADYYWLWTPEGWTWGGNKPEEFAATKQDILTALQALRVLGDPFTLATCGWVLGPQDNRSALDEFLPKTAPMSCINRTVGHDGVEPAFAGIAGRPKWAIPWMENDPNLIGPQPWVARMRYDAVDARRFGCSGLLGIHWRTKALAPNVAALAAAAWDQSWVPASFDTSLAKPQKTGDGAVGGQTVSFNEQVGGTALPSVYQTVRYGMNGYNLTVPNGGYTVTLQFNEPHYTAAGKRVFGARLQGQQVLTHLDIFARVGRNQALDQAYPGVVVTNGLLRIDFTAETEFPCIAGISIEGTTQASNQVAGQPFSRKINCGGDAVADYEADRLAEGAQGSAPKSRAMPIQDFYLDFARANFGASVAEPVGEILARIDGIHLPQISDWKTGPGDLVPISAPWSEVKKQYLFVDELGGLRAQIKSPGDLERFDYWLNTYRAMSVMAEVSCQRGELDQAMKEKDYTKALSARLRLAKAWSRLLSLQASIVDTPGEMGTIANLEQHVRRHAGFLEAHDKALEQGLGSALPPEARPSKEYTGPTRILVPTVRSVVRRGEALTLPVMVLNSGVPSTGTVHFRAMGKGRWRKLPLAHVGRAVFEVQLPRAQETLEYYVTAETTSGRKWVWPATAPELNQTVVVRE